MRLNYYIYFRDDLEGWTWERDLHNPYTLEELYLSEENRESTSEHIDISKTTQSDTEKTRMDGVSSSSSFESFSPTLDVVETEFLTIRQKNIYADEASSSSNFELFLPTLDEIEMSKLDLEGYLYHN